MKSLFPPAPQPTTYHHDSTSKPAAKFVHVFDGLFYLTEQQIAQLQEMAGRFQDANTFGTSVKFRP